MISFNFPWGFLFMECVTWLTHKYLMHGFMWYFEDHHQPKYANIFERNDIFFAILLFRVFSFFCWSRGWFYLFFIGLGITAYGFCYFMIHDVLIHKDSNGLRLQKIDTS
jgi:beta-carotene 3-hydroxylase